MVRTSILWNELKKLILDSNGTVLEPLPYLNVFFASIGMSRERRVSRQDVGHRVRLVPQQVVGLIPATVEQLDLGWPFKRARTSQFLGRGGGSCGRAMNSSYEGLTFSSQLSTFLQQVTKLWNAVDKKASLFKDDNRWCSVKVLRWNFFIYSHNLHLQ